MRRPGNRARWRDGRRGNAMVEFALSFGFLFSVFAGVFQFGYVYFLYNQLENAVRGGARYASLRAYDSATATPSDGFAAAVKNVVVYGNPAGTGAAIAPGLTPEKVSIAVVMERNVPRKVTLSIVNYRLDAVVTSFTLNGKPKVSFPYMGRFAPPGT